MSTPISIQGVCISNHVVLADISDHFGTLSKIEGIFWENAKQKRFYRKTNLSAAKWTQLNLDVQKLLKENIPFPHALDVNSFANGVKGTYDQVFDKCLKKKTTMSIGFMRIS